MLIEALLPSSIALLPLAPYQIVHLALPLLHSNLLVVTRRSSESLLLHRLHERRLRRERYLHHHLLVLVLVAKKSFTAAHCDHP